MPFNAADYIKPPSSEYATDRELQGDQTDLKINDLRRDTITCINALAAGAPSGSVTVDSINSTPTVISSVKNITPPVISGTIGQRVVATNLGTMVLSNCSFDGTNFTADDTGLGADGIIVSAAGLTIMHQTTVASPWSSWENVEIKSPGNATIQSLEAGGTIHPVYGELQENASPGTLVSGVFPYGMYLNFVPVLTITTLASSNVSPGSIVVSNLNNRAAVVSFVPQTPGSNSLLRFSISVAHP